MIKTIKWAKFFSIATFSNFSKYLQEGDELTHFFLVVKLFHRLSRLKENP